MTTDTKDLCRTKRHRLTPENTRIDSEGNRRCRACENKKSSRRKYRARAAFKAVRPAHDAPEREAWHAERVASYNRTRHAKCGHEFVSGNIRWTDTGHPACSECFRRSQRERYARQRAKKELIAVREASADRETPEYLDWKLRGACFETELPPDTWFASKETLVDKAERKTARFACAKCAVKQLCLAAGASEEYGIWGGTIPEDRAAYRNGTITFEQLKELSA